MFGRFFSSLLIAAIKTGNSSKRFRNRLMKATINLNLEGNKENNYAWASIVDI